MAVLLTAAVLIIGGAIIPADAERVPVKDLDYDGMDDEWEGINGLDNTTNDANADLDSDGSTNIEEFLGYDDPNNAEDSKAVRDNRMLVFIGVALSCGIAATMASIGTGHVGSGAMGVVVERPEKFGRLIIYQAIPMTQGIYGLLMAILMINFTGLVGGPEIAVLKGPYVGWGALAIGIVIAFSSISAIPQGMVATAAAAAFGRNTAVFGKGVVFAVMVETFAIFGVLVSIFLLLASGML
jgi:V/A-type H+-transporting ATPase subunit K